MKNIQQIQNKIVSRHEAVEIVKRWKSQGEKLVFTNGCFDIVHKGHVFFLAEAHDFGTKLVVGLNTDASVKRLKGEGRPVKEEESRMYTLAAFSCVDLIVLFDEETPYNLINALVPDVLVKGKDYQISEIVGADVVLKHGGVVETIDLQKGFSSTAYITKM
jgi:rfaE bifunctional protein nucleotidyltransferase chain/domain